MKKVFHKGLITGKTIRYDSNNKLSNNRELLDRKEKIGVPYELSDRNQKICSYNYYRKKDKLGKIFKEDYMNYCNSC